MKHSKIAKQFMFFGRGLIAEQSMFFGRGLIAEQSMFFGRGLIAKQSMFFGVYKKCCVWDDFFAEKIIPYTTFFINSFFGQGLIAEQSMFFGRGLIAEQSMFLHEVFYGMIRGMKNDKLLEEESIWTS